MKALVTYNAAVDVETTGARVILHNGEPCNYAALSPEQKNDYDRVADALYDLPLFDGERISARFAGFEASAPAIMVINDDAREIIERGCYDAAVAFMDDEIREELHRQIAPCTDEEFLTAYLAAHKAKYQEAFIVN